MSDSKVETCGKYTTVGPILCGAREELAEWIRKRIPGCERFNPIQCLGAVRDGELAAAIGYYNRFGHSIELIIAADNPRWATREVIYTFLDYPFRALNARRLHSLVKPDNHRAIKLNEGVGMVREGYLRKCFVGDYDGILYGLLPEDFYASKFARKAQQHQLEDVA